MTTKKMTMTIQTSYWVRCTACNNEESRLEESPEDAKESAMIDGFCVDVRVPNGSLWDFCPKCWVAYMKEKNNGKV